MAPGPGMPHQREPRWQRLIAPLAAAGSGRELRDSPGEFPGAILDRPEDIAADGDSPPSADRSR